MEDLEALKRQEEEKWKDLTVFYEDTDESKDRLETMFTIPKTVVESTTTALAYLDMISPSVVDEYVNETFKNLTIMQDKE